MSKPDPEAFHNWTPAAQQKAAEALAEADRARERYRPWYCPNPECDGEPHDEWTWRHCRVDQRPPPGDWFVWTMRGGRGCIAPWTRIYNPETGSHKPVTEILEETSVQTLKGTAKASTPFIKGTAHMWTVTTSRGDQVTVTDEHRFLTPQGWTALGSLRVGQLVAVAPHAHRPEAAPFQSVSHASVPSSPRIHEDFPIDYQTYHHFDGRPPQSYVEDAQTRPLPQDGAAGHIHYSWHGDVQASSGECNHACPQCIRQPKSSFSPGEPLILNVRYHDEPWQCESFRDSFRAPELSHRWTSLDPEAVAAGDRRKQLLSLGSLSQRASDRAADLGRFLEVFAQQSATKRQELWKSQSASAPDHAYELPTSDQRLSSVLPIEAVNPHSLIFGSELLLESRSLQPELSGTCLPDTDEPVDLLPWVDSFCQILSIEYSHYGIYYDLTVPDGHHYTAEGIIHHNSGKSRAGSEWVRQMTSRVPRIALVGRTSADFRDTMIEGVSGILSVCPPKMQPHWEPSKRRLTFPNGCVVTAYSAEEPDRLRGPQFGAAWLDEAAHFAQIEEVWDNLTLGLRLGSRPRACVTTTPRPIKWMRNIIAEPTTVDVRVSTYANLDNLAPSYRATVLDRFEGTRTGKQELYGELLEDVVGALWNIEMIEENRVESAPDMDRIVVAIDPAGSSNKNSDETGIIVVGKSGQHAYVLADYTGRYSPHGWARRADIAYSECAADAIVYETNYGGEMVTATLRGTGTKARLKPVHSRRGKSIRAEPIVSKYEQGAVHHIGSLDQLETEQVTWIPGEGDSPNRVDACLVAGTRVLAEAGEVPIEHVTPGMKVWTRGGWSTVLHGGLTQRAAPVMTARLSNGRYLTCTPDHRIWTARGWVRMDALVHGDSLSGWSLPSKSPTEAWHIAETPMRPSERTASTTPPQGDQGEAFFTGTSTATTTAPSPRAVMSITATKTPSTTRPGTSRPSRRRSMLRYILGGIRAIRRNWHTWHTWRPSDLWPQSGTGARRAELGTSSMLGEPGNATRSSAHVNSAETSLMRGWPLQSSAPESASLACNEPQDGTAKTPSASLAGRPSRERSTGSDQPRPAPVRVLRVFERNEVADVYDLTVDDVHEFVAEGVVVHNCVHGLTELLKPGAPVEVYAPGRR